LRLTNLTSYWYRRGCLNLAFKAVLNAPKGETTDHLFYESLNTYLVKENEIAVNSLYDLLHKLNGFGKLKENETNKLINLMVAKSVGLKIPHSIVSKQKDVLLDFSAKSNNELITKALHQGGFVFWANQYMFGLTKIVEEEEIQKMQGNWLSFLQNKINKKFEIRIFYLDSKIFAAAIFSQSNKKTSVDFRNYDRDKPNRVVPYLLPKIIENKVIEFMKTIGMKSGSIDLIVDENNDYIFLEVNPIGQFAQVSIPCNYYIEEYIANYLINEKN
jgi:ATP-GRASP peptide maturase of grasp-with-spasm system